MDFLRRKRLVVVLSVAVLVVLIVAFKLLGNYTNTLVGSLLREIVQEESNGQYIATVGEIRYNIGNGRFYIADFHVHPSDAVSRSLQTIDSSQNLTVFEAFVPQFHINPGNLLDLYLKKELRIRDIEFWEPVVHITQFGESATPDKSFDTKANVLYKTITKSLRVLQINNFNLVDGYFRLMHHRGAALEQYVIRDISMKIENFLLTDTPADGQTDFYYTDNVEVEMKSQNIMLFDSLHYMSFERALISTITRDIILEDFRIAQRMMPPAAARADTVPYRLDVHLPKIRIRGVDFIRLYQDQQLVVQDFDVQEPEIKIYAVSQGQDASKTERSGQGLRDLLKSIDIQGVQLRDAALDLDLSTPGGTYKFAGNLKEITTKNFTLEMPDTISGPSFQYEMAQLRAGPSQLQLPGIKGTVDWQRLEIVGQDGHFDVALRGLRTISAASYTSVNTPSYTGSIPYVALEGIDVAGFFETDTLRVNTCTLDKPDLALNLPASSPRRMRTASASPAHTSDPKFTLQLGQVAVNEATVQVDHNTGSQKHRGRIARYSFEIRDVLLNNEMLGTRRLPFLNRMQHQMHDIQLSLPGEQQINVEELQLDTEGGTLALRDLDFRSEETGIRRLLQQLQRKATVQSIEFIGFDLAAMVANKAVDIDRIEISPGGIEYNVHSPKNTPRSDKGASKAPLDFPIHIGSMTTGNLFIDIKQDGEPMFSTAGLQIDAANLRYEADPGAAFKVSLTAQDASASVSRFIYHLHDIEHLLSGERLDFDMQGPTVTARELMLQPAPGAGHANVYNVTLPQCTIANIDVDRAINNASYVCKSLEISDPQVDIWINDTTQDESRRPVDANGSTSSGSLPKVTLDRVAVLNASVAVRTTGHDENRELKVKKADLQASNVEIDSIPGKILKYVDSARVRLQYGSYQHKNQFVSVNRINLVTSKGLLEVDGLYFSNNATPPPYIDPYLKADIDHITVAGLDLAKIIKHKQIDGGTLKVVRPSIRMQTDHKPDSGSEKVFQGVRITLDTDAIHQLMLDTVELKQGKLDARIGTENGFQHLQLQSVNLHGSGIDLTPKYPAKTAEAPRADDLYVNVEGLTMTGHEKLSAVNIGKVAAGLQTRSLRLSDLTVEPLVTKYEYGPQKGFQTDWINLTNQEIDLQEVDFYQLIDEGTLSIGRILVTRPVLTLFRDKRVPFPEDQRRNMPQKDISNIPLPVVIDTLELRNGFVSYLEHGVQSNAPGEVFFSDLHGIISNITNDPQALRKQDKMSLQAEGYLMGKGLIDAAVVFDLADEDNAFVLGATVQSFDLTELNRMLSPNVFVEIMTGHNERILMNVKGNNEYSYGEMEFFYNDLKIALLNKETETPVGVGNAMGSFFANTFIIHANNPRKLKLRKGEIFFERDKRKSIFNFWSKTFLSGVVTSVGAKSNQKNIREIQQKQMQKYADQISQ